MSKCHHSLQLFGDSTIWATAGLAKNKHEHGWKKNHAELINWEPPPGLPPAVLCLDCIENVYILAFVALRATAEDVSVSYGAPRVFKQKEARHKWWEAISCVPSRLGEAVWADSRSLTSCVPVGKMALATSIFMIWFCDCSSHRWLEKHTWFVHLKRRLRTIKSATSSISSACASQPF